MNKPITIMPLNEFHMDHKVRMQSTDLDLLKSASFGIAFTTVCTENFPEPSKLGEYLNIHVCTLVIGEYVPGDRDLSTYFYESNPLHPKNWMNGDRPERVIKAQAEPTIPASVIGCGWRK